MAADGSGRRIAAMATAPEQIFKAYDVRGLYGDDIDADIAEGLGRAFIRVLAELSGKPAGDQGIQDMRKLIDAGLGEAPGGGSTEEIDIYPDFHAAAMTFIDPANVKP